MHSWIILKRLPLCSSSHSHRTTRLFCSTHSNFELLWTKHKKIPNGHWESKENRIEYVNFLSRKLNIKTMEDWYRVTYNDLSNNHGLSLIKYYGSTIKAITSFYPDYNWLPWKFMQIPKGFWHDEKNIQNYMNWLSQQLNIKTTEDWYKITNEEIIQNHGGSILDHFESRLNLMKHVYPNYNWLPWKFKQISRSFWNDENNVAAYMNWLSERLNIKTMEDWYKISYEDIAQNYGHSLVLFKGGLYTTLITSYYQNYNWLPWKFKLTPKGFWKDRNNVKQYMNWLSEKLNISTMEDWYKVSCEDIDKNYGSTLIKQYNSSNANLIISSYPDYNWLPWKFVHVPKGYWNDEKNVKLYFDWLSQQLNITTMEDWYKVTNEEIIQNYGGTLIKHMKNSSIYTKIHLLLKIAYPEYKWDVFRFTKAPNGYKERLLEDPSLQREFVNYIEKKFNIKQTSDWYSITNLQLKRIIHIDFRVALEIIKTVYSDLDTSYWK